MRLDLGLQVRNIHDEEYTPPLILTVKM